MLNFAGVSIFKKKLAVFWLKNKCEHCVEDFLVLFLILIRRKANILKNI